MALKDFFKRQHIYVNTELQFAISITLVVVVTVEILLFGGIFSWAFSIPQQTPDAIYRTWALILILFIIVVLLNVFIGVLLSHKIAGPMYVFENRVKEITNGDISRNVDLREGDMLKDFENSFNEMLRTLRINIGQDRNKAKRSLEMLKNLKKKLKQTKAKTSGKEVLALIEDLNNEIKNISSFFRL